MPNIDLILVIGFLFLGGFVFLAIVAGARHSAVAQAERKWPKPAPTEQKSTTPPVVQGVDI